MNRRAYTLIEVLTVISIILVLSAILLPVYRSAREFSLKAVSKSNLRQVYMSTEMYRSDWDGDGVYGNRYAMGFPPSPPTNHIKALLELVPPRAPHPASRRSIAGG